MTETKQKTVWKTYPEFPFIQANQFGEVRTIDRTITGKNGRKLLVKGRVLKQQLLPDGYLQVHFRVNRKSIFMYVHRIMASCFIPNTNNWPEVNHKDNNRANNVVSNLEWCTHQYNQDYKKNFGTSSAEVLGKPVFAVNLETGKVLYFESQSEASRQLGVHSGGIGDVLKGRLNQIGGYWFTEDKSEITEEKIRKIKAKMYFRGGVVAINLETSEVFRFKTQLEAARQLGVDVGSINKVIKGKRYKTAGGYWFCYADENAVEKTRAKLGDDIANKVKELMSNELQSA